MSGDASISIIVPVLNEAEHLAATLASIGSPVQLIVVDGGSSDDSAGIARCAGAEVIASTVQQRAAQLNFGAERATGDVLLFLHADTRLPQDWSVFLRNALARDPHCVGGAFRRRFDFGSRFLAVTCALADWRGAIFNVFLGDQAMFVRREVFRTLGGFAPLQRCEDLDLSMRLARTGRCRLLPATVITSGRRFQLRGVVRQTLHDFVVAGRFVAGRRANAPASSRR
jgi:rSAM/selenodomain-associated transferase 2